MVIDLDWQQFSEHSINAGAAQEIQVIEHASSVSLDLAKSCSARGWLVAGQGAQLDLRQDFIVLVMSMASCALHCVLVQEGSFQWKPRGRSLDQLDQDPEATSMDSFEYYFGRWALAGSFSINENMISTGVMIPCDTNIQTCGSQVTLSLIDACLYVLYLTGHADTSVLHTSRRNVR